MLIEDGQIVSLGDSRLERVHNYLITVGVVDLEYRQLHKKAYTT